MQCPRCLNTDEEYFYKGNRGWYCRRCIPFGRVMLEEDREPVSLSLPAEGCEEYTLPYPLTKQQSEISEQCARLIEKTDVLLHCVCGAGKTELVIASIAKMLEKGKKVCFAIPRRQVVLELRERLASYFPNAEVVAVCGGHTETTDGDLIVATTHQLYRYYGAFDLLILDAYGIIGLNSKDSINKGFSGISPILFSPQKRLTVELRRCHAQIKDFSAKRPAAGMHSSIAGSIIPFCVLQRQSNELSSDVDLHRSSLWNQKDVSLACNA